MSKKVFTAADMEAFLKSGKTAADLPKDVLLTPSAKDVLRYGVGGGRSYALGSAPVAAAASGSVWRTGSRAAPGRGGRQAEHRPGPSSVIRSIS